MAFSLYDIRFLLTLVKAMAILEEKQVESGELLNSCSIKIHRISFF